MRCQNYLQHHRRQAKLSQLDLAKELGDGVGRVIVSNWETGISSPTEIQKKMISNILGIGEEVLFPKETVVPIRSTNFRKR